MLTTNVAEVMAVTVATVAGWTLPLLPLQILYLNVLTDVFAACVLSGLLLGQRWLGLTELEAVTISFLTLGFGKVWFTFSLRSPRSGVLRNEVTRNPWVWGAIALCIALLLAAVYLPGLSGLLQTRTLGWRGWALLLEMSFIPLVAGQGLRGIQRRRGAW